MSITSSVRYPMERDGWTRTVLIGGILLFFSLLLVPMFAAYGYVVRSIKQSTSGDPEPPVLNEWGVLVVQGLQAWLIGIVYMLIPLVVAGLTVGSAATAALSGGNAGAAIGFGSLLLGLTLSVVLSLVFGYLAVIGVVNFAREGRFGAGFDLGTIKTVAFDGDYAIAWLASVAVFFVVSLVSAIPIIGWVLTPFALFYALVVAADLWANGFEQAIQSRSGLNRSRDPESAI